MSTPIAEEHCQFFVVRKKRHCRMTVRKGQRFCGEHIDNKTEEDINRRRVICPHDNNHTCYAHHLQKHLLKCNAQPPKVYEPYIVPGINSPIDSSGTEVFRMNLSDVSDQDLLQVIAKIKKVFKELPVISTSIMEHPALTEELNKPENGQSARKHLVQNASLLGNMQKNGLLQEDICYIEFGAGRGQLSYWLADSLTNDQSMFLLIDRASQRHRYDSRKKDGNSKLKNAVRIKADIKDLYLNKISMINRQQSIVAVSKHLCGAATDLALTCLSNSMKGSMDNKLMISGIMIAFCCHHQCNWVTYTGKSFLLSRGFSVEDFNIMCSVVSWATCGSGRSRTWAPPVVEDTEQLPQLENDRYSQLKLQQDERKNVGRQCKLIMDYGRFLFLTELGFKGQLVYYVDQTVSPENVCMLVTA